jgi:hypothetical protein
VKSTGFLLLAATLVALAPATTALAQGGDGNAWHQLDVPGGYPGPYGPSSRSSFDNRGPRGYDGWDVGAPSAIGIFAFQANVAGNGVAPYFNGCFQVQPAFDRHGVYLSSKWVYICR